MNEKFSRARVKGFLRAEGRSIVNEDGEEVLLAGWGLGNWLLPEGYMWTAHTSRFDRPRRIESVIRELTGTAYAEQFWAQFREHYVTREDIRLMAEQGYNSVRIPINWRLLMEDEPGIAWIEEGFRLIDRCLDWCEEFKLYAFLDLHGAPGGQTGANIDDSIDDVPRLFTDADSWDKGIRLWEALAERYKDRWIVGGYDLLNEPLKQTYGGEKSVDYLVPKLIQFYEESIAAIRAIDALHMLSIEGHHWATNTSIFYKRYDDNMHVHFHRYACLPDISAYAEFIELSERLNVPLWLGETGENITEWFAAMYPLAADLNIGYNLWPWKKMNCANSPYSIPLPDGWDKIMDYTKGGPHPGYELARAILDQYLTNIQAANCAYNADVTSAVFRTPGCSVRATDFDELPGRGEAYSGLRTEGNPYRYRSKTGMRIVEDTPIEQLEKRFFFDVLWDRFLLEMQAGEFAAYSINDTIAGSTVAFDYRALEPAEITIAQDGRELCKLELEPGEGKQRSAEIALLASSESKVRIAVHRGTVQFERIIFG
ncbi:glycoside hydrolase family 5 protein [Paenibacillus aurantiacus]|uniref:Glycoside hydrolase family 5 protein n=1 Tax=Paenibacillus aurantiacus TaxID=1936118 RepID=A0ABV5KMG0_9BACL